MNPFILNLLQSIAASAVTLQSEDIPDALVNETLEILQSIDADLLSLHEQVVEQS